MIEILYVLFLLLNFKTIAICRGLQFTEANIQDNLIRAVHRIRKTLVRFLLKDVQLIIRELKQATFLSTRTAAGSKLRRYRW